MKFEKYNKENSYSFSFGAFPTYELIKNKPEQCKCVILHSKLKHTTEVDNLLKLCQQNAIEFYEDDKQINKVADKENCFIMGVFEKYVQPPTQGNHLVLVCPSDMGNLGTIMRTALGFNFCNINIIKPCVDIFNPKVVRASMGAIFSLNITQYNNVEEYLNSNNNKKYFFMLQAKNKLGSFTFAKENADLVFGNEASGLPENLLHADESVIIAHSNKIDSLNLPISIGIALYEFNK